MHSSPGTPTGTGCSRRVEDIERGVGDRLGRPRSTRPRPRRRARPAAPSTRSSSRSGRTCSTAQPTRGSSRAASSRGNASPPHSTLSRRSPSQPASSSIRQVAGVACIDVIACRASRRPSSSPSEACVPRRDPPGAPTISGRQQLQAGDVERQRGDGQQHVRRARAPARWRIERRKFTTARCGTATPFGLAGRARRVDHVREVVGASSDRSPPFGDRASSSRRSRRGSQASRQRRLSDHAAAEAASSITPGAPAGTPDRAARRRRRPSARPARRPRRSGERSSADPHQRTPARRRARAGGARAGSDRAVQLARRSACRRPRRSRPPPRACGRPAREQRVQPSRRRGSGTGVVPLLQEPGGARPRSSAVSSATARLRVPRPRSPGASRSDRISARSWLARTGRC